LDKQWVLKKHGVTQGFLAAWLTCPELARLRYQEGWTVIGASGALMFGQVVHWVLDAVYTDFANEKVAPPTTNEAVQQYTRVVEGLWRRENPMATAADLEQLEECLGMAEAVLPFYFQHWTADFQKTDWLALELSFEELWSLPLKTVRSKPRGVWIRGKLDGVRRVNGKLWLFETKTKGRVESEAIVDTLSMDLQVNLYLWVIQQIYEETPVGTVYNIIRRPGLKRGGSETLEDFCARIAKDVVTRPDHYFMRFESVAEETEHKAWQENLTVVLDRLSDWAKKGKDHFKNPISCQGRYGVCDMAGLCLRGDPGRLRVRDTVFPELEEGGGL